MQRIIFQARQQFLRVILYSVRILIRFFFVLTPDNTFFLVNNESIGADANYFFKCRDDVCTDACLFCCKCIVDAAVHGQYLFTFDDNFTGIMCEFFTSDDTLRLIARDFHIRSGF